MLLLRLLIFLWLLVLGAALVLFVVTRERRYRDFAKRVFQYGLILALAIFAFFILERVVLTV